MFKLQAIKNFPKVKGDKYKITYSKYPNDIYTVREFWYDKKQKFYGSLYRLLAENGGIDNVDLKDIAVNNQEFGGSTLLVDSVKLTNKKKKQW